MSQRIGDRLIEHDLCEERLYADPGRTQELLFLALAISRALREGKPPLRRLRLVPVAATAEASRAMDALKRAEQLLRLGPDVRHHDPHWRLRRLIGGDAPRYEPRLSANGPCEAPMARRGGPCGQLTSHSVLVRNRDDGTMAWRFCCRRHEAWRGASQDIADRVGMPEAGQ